MGSLWHRATQVRSIAAGLALKAEGRRSASPHSSFLFRVLSRWCHQATLIGLSSPSTGAPRADLHIGKEKAPPGAAARRSRRPILRPAFEVGSLEVRRWMRRPFAGVDTGDIDCRTNCSASIEKMWQRSPCSVEGLSIGPLTAVLDDRPTGCI